jgi:hypothetical protein
MAPHRGSYASRSGGFNPFIILTQTADNDAGEYVTGGRSAGVPPTLEMASRRSSRRTPSSIESFVPITMRGSVARAAGRKCSAAQRGVAATQSCGMAILAMIRHGQDARATSRVCLGATGAGPGAGTGQRAGLNVRARTSTAQPPAAKAIRQRTTSFQTPYHHSPLDVQ